MPTYCATGVTATLKVCNLQAALSSVVDLRQGKEQRSDEARVQKVLANAEKLPERVIGDNGGESGVVRFLGVNEDMAMFMVEAGKRVGVQRDVDGDGDAEMAMDGRPDSAMVMYSDDSPLTSLGATPTPTQQSFDGSPSKAATPGNTQAPPYFGPGLEERLQSTHALLAPSTQQALVLEVEVSENSFLAHKTKRPGGASLGKDLKLEVFINGELADVQFINARRSAVQFTKDRLRFSGVRVHRQTEKPWIYHPGDGDADMVGSKDARSGWNAVCDSLAREAALRGRGKFGNLPPSAEFLMALAALELPERMKGHEALGVVDLVITAGKGRKYGPETPYITGPTRMDDAEYQTTSDPTIDPMLCDSTPLFAGLEGLNDSPVRMKPLVPAGSSPDVLLRNSTLRQSPIPTPKKTTLDLAADLGLDIDPNKVSIEGYENAKGKRRGSRTLKQRLGDVGKMNEEKQAMEIEKLREEFGAEMNVREDSGMTEPVAKRLKMGVQVDMDAEMAMYDDVGGQVSNPFIDPALTRSESVVNPALVGGDGTIDPMLMYNVPPQLPQDVDPEFLPAQNRIDLALSEGAASNGHLLRSIASTSPQRTAQRITQASSLAHSPTSTPVKSQLRHKVPKTPKRSKSAFKESGISPFAAFATPQHPSSSKLAAATPTRSAKTTSGRGSGRSARKWLPTEKAPADVLREFEVAEACQGSCVSYAEGEAAQRQIGKARRGEFREETVLVGMRFCVV